MTWYLSAWRIAPFGRFWQAGHPPRYAAFNQTSSPKFPHSPVKLLRVLTDRGSEYCGNPERHEYELYLAVEDIDHSRTKTKSPQTNGICERFHKTVLNEF